MPVYEFSDGEFWGNMIMNDMKNWVSGWIYWNMILDQNGGPWLVSVEHGDPDDNRSIRLLLLTEIPKKLPIPVYIIIWLISVNLSDPELTV